MITTFTLIDLAGSVALLLLGTQMVQTGMHRAFGAGLRSLLGRSLRGGFRAFLAGTGTTAVLQSSATTGLMIEGFAAEGGVGLVPALAVMLGANVGVTLIVQVLSGNGGHPLAPLWTRLAESTNFNTCYRLWSPDEMDLPDFCTLSRRPSCVNAIRDGNDPLLTAIQQVIAWQIDDRLHPDARYRP